MFMGFTNRRSRARHGLCVLGLVIFAGLACFLEGRHASAQRAPLNSANGDPRKVSSPRSEADPPEAQIHPFKPSNDELQAPVAGVTQLSLATKDILYDRFRQTIYASIPSNGGANANTVVPINPVTGNIGTPLTTGDNPGRLALSGDGHYLYVGIDGAGSIRRLDLQSQTAPTEFSLGTGLFGPPLKAEEIEVLPGQPESIAVSLQSGGHEGVAIYDNGVRRTNQTPIDPMNDVIEFGADASTLYGENTTNTEFGFHRLAVNSNGVSMVGTLRNLASGNEADMRFDNGLMYLNNGFVIDLQAFALTGRFNLPGGSSTVLPDSANNRVFFITGAAIGQSGLWAFDLHTFLPVGKVAIPSLAGFAKRLIQCGAGQLALRTTTNQVYLISTSAIEPFAPAPLPSPTVGADSVTKLQLATNDLVYDQGTQRVYASIPGDVSYGNSLAPIDPSTGNVSQPIFIGSDPTKLAVSDNNQFLYAGLDGASGVRQFNLSSQVAGSQFSLGFDGGTGPLYVNDMEVQPGNPSVVAVARKNKGFSPNTVDVALFDHGVRATNARDEWIFGITFGGSPSLLYGATIFGDLESISVSGSGLSLLSSSRHLIGGDIKFDNGLIYTTAGEVLDPATSTVLGTFPVSGLVAPDSSSGRVYYLYWTNAAPTVATIYGFDSQTFVPLEYLTISNLSGTPGSFIRWGADGFAFRTSASQVYFLRKSSFHPYPTITPTVTTRPDGIRKLTLLANDIAYNPADHLIYASVPSAAGSIGNSITSFDPVAGSVGQSVFMGSEPYKISISDTGTALYASLGGVPRVRRMSLPNMSPGPEFGVGADIISGVFYPSDLAVAPGNPDVVAVSTYRPDILGGAGIVLVDHGVVLPNHTGGTSLAVSGANLFTYTGDSSEFGLRNLAFTSQGFSEVNYNTNLVNGFGSKIAAAGGRIYGSDGAVIDADTLTLAGKFRRSSGGIWLAPDPANNRVYFLGSGENSSLQITSFDSRNFLQVGSLAINNVSSSGSPINFIRYGTDGLAFNTAEGDIYLLNTGMIVPLNPTPAPAPVQVTPEVKRLPLTTGDLVYNSNDGMIYGSVPSRTDVFVPGFSTFGSPISFGNSIVPIDPVSGTMGQPIAAGSEPKKLAISNSGQYIYAALDGEGAVCRIDLPSKTIGSRFSLGNDEPYKGPRYVYDMEVAPNNPGTVAISRFHKNGIPSHLGVAIYDNGAQRPITTENTFPSYTDNNNLITYSDSATTIWGYNLEQSTRDFHKLTVSSSGVTMGNKVQNLFDATDIKFDNGLIYSDSGQVVNPLTATVVGTYPGLGFCDRLVYPESVRGTVYFLVSNCNGIATIRAYNQTTFALTGTLSISGVNGSLASFIRWGANGFAFRTTSNSPTQSNQVFIVQSSSLVPPIVNQIDTADVFVRQHYLDFLNRQPDPAGLAFWTNEITSCGTDQHCIEVKRINVSTAYFLSIEFQQTGYLVERIYKAAYGDASGASTFGGPHTLPVPIIRLSEFLPDTQAIGLGVVVGQSGWEQTLENNKVAFTSGFVERSRFSSAYATSLTPAQFVDALFAHAGVTPSAAERDVAIGEFGAAANTSDSAARGRALRRVAENSTLSGAEFNRAFVLMQYFGYLRRNPNDPQDPDYSGYDFWLTKLNNFTIPGEDPFIRAQRADMVKAFITSGEYRHRFGP
jgi:hypothetical protein